MKDISKGVFKKMSIEEQNELVFKSMATIIGYDENKKPIMVLGKDRYSELNDYIDKMNKKYEKG